MIVVAFPEEKYMTAGWFNATTPVPPDLLNYH
jgi:hypothetical protein